jgi:alpha-L-fucosidase 2
MNKNKNILLSLATLLSHTGEIELLPALPKAWPSGSVKGLCARGGFEVDMEWKGSALVSATIRSVTGKTCKVRYGEKTVDLSVPGGRSKRLTAELVE